MNIKNELKENKIIKMSKSLLAHSLAFAILCGALPFGLMYSFAENVQTEEGTSDSNGSEQLPEYDPSEYETSDEIKQAIDELKESLENLDGKKNDLYLQLEEALANKEQIESKYLAEKLEADAEIQLIEIKLGVFEEIVAQYDLLIDNKEKEIEDIEKEYDKMYGVFAERLRQSHEEGLPGMLEIFLSSGSFIQMLTSIERMKDILEHDTKVMEELEDMKNAHTAEKKELEDYLAQQRDIIKELEAGRSALELKLEESQKILDLQENNIDEYLLLLEIAEENRVIMNQRIEQALKDYYEQLDKENDKAYQLTEEYKRIYVAPEILKKMNNGEICKGSEYEEFEEDGEQYIWPLPMKYYAKRYITSDFGPRTYTNSEGKLVHSNHKGYDIGVPAKTEIYAVRSGTVITAAYSSSYGYYIVILHDDETTTIYAHCSKLLAVEGEYVLQGEYIARVGSTGQSTGNHLHIEIRKDNKPVDPSFYIVMPGTNKDED